MTKVNFDSVVVVGRNFLVVCALLAFFFFVSCTDTSSSSSALSEGHYSYPQEMPECSESFEGNYFTLLDTTYVCSKGLWEIVTVSSDILFPPDTTEKTNPPVDSDTLKVDTSLKDTSLTDTLQKNDTSVVADTAKKDSIPAQILEETKNVYVSGVVEYGRFNTKSTIIAEELDASLNKTGVSFTGSYSTKDGSFNIKNAVMKGPYVLITISGATSNMALGSMVLSNESLSVIARVNDSISVNINVLSSLVGERITELMKTDASMDFTVALEKAIGDAWTFFGYDTLKSEDPAIVNMANGGKSGSTLFALTILIQSLTSESGSNLNEISRIFANGKKIDSLSIAKMADWSFEENMSDAYAEVIDNAKQMGINEVAEIKSVLEDFYQKNLGIDACDESKNGEISFAKNKYSAYYAADYSDASVTRERIVCEDELWRVALDKEKDTYGFEGASDGETRQGLVNKDFIYSYNGSSWRLVKSLAEIDAYFVEQSNITDFIDIQEVYESIKPDERVIFLLRHGERDKDKTSKQDPLSEKGYEESIETGAKLNKFSEPFRLGASEFYRAQQTVIGMAVGRGQDTVVADTLSFLNDDWYMIDREKVNQAEGKAGGGWEAIGRYVYAGEYPEAYYNLEERSAKLIDTLLTTYANVPERFILLSSHDKLMVPFVAYCSERKINMDVKGGGTWINYLAGIAIIWDKSGNRRYVAFKGLESAYFRGW